MSADRQPSWVKWYGGRHAFLGHLLWACDSGNYLSFPWPWVNGYQICKLDRLGSISSLLNLDVDIGGRGRVMQTAAAAAMGKGCHHSSVHSIGYSTGQVGNEVSSPLNVAIRQ